jgi:hypothetical protein
MEDPGMFTRVKLFTFLRMLYITISNGYTPQGSREKNYFIATKKRNLLSRSLHDSFRTGTLYNKAPPILNPAGLLRCKLAEAVVL